MATPKRASASFEERAHRAEELARLSAPAREALEFGAGLYRAQGGVALDLEERRLTGKLAEDLAGLAKVLPELLAFLSREGPSVLAQEARSRREEDPKGDQLLLYWKEGGREDYVSRALLRPYVEVLARSGVSPDRSHVEGCCPVCGGAPWVAARVGGTQLEGAHRRLVCGLCGESWTFPRIRCPSCREEDPKKLPSFASETHPEARIEACETCHAYIKSIDLGQDARRIPEVDDLLSLSLDLWAVERGFVRIEPGLAGV